MTASQHPPSISLIQAHKVRRSRVGIADLDSDDIGAELCRHLINRASKIVAQVSQAGGLKPIRGTKIPALRTGRGEVNIEMETPTRGTGHEVEGRGGTDSPGQLCAGPPNGSAPVRDQSPM